MSTTNANQLPEKTQIFVAKTDKNVFEAIDSLDFAQPKFSKIRLNLVQHDVTPSVFVSHSINPDVLKVVAQEILSGSFEKNFPKGFKEYKGSANSKREDGKPEARTLTIAYNAGKNYPWYVQIAVGEGQVIGQGAVKMVKEEQRVFMSLSDMDMKRFATEVMDYIRDFEQYHRFIQWKKTN